MIWSRLTWNVPFNTPPPGARLAPDAYAGFNHPNGLLAADTDKVKASYSNRRTGTR